MKDLDVIKLYCTEQGWMARSEGPHTDRIRELFGTDTLPIAFTAEAQPAMVLQAIARLNPHALVLLA